MIYSRLVGSAKTSKLLAFKEWLTNQETSLEYSSKYAERRRILATTHCHRHLQYDEYLVSNNYPRRLLEDPLNWKNWKTNSVDLCGGQVPAQNLTPHERHSGEIIGIPGGYATNNSKRCRLLHVRHIILLPTPENYVKSTSRELITKDLTLRTKYWSRRRTT